MTAKKLVKDINKKQKRKNEKKQKGKKATIWF